MSAITLLRTAPAKANELFSQIADTSPTALKTRDRLLVELKRELEEISRLEEEHLLPVIRKRAETKELGPKLIASLKARREMIEKLEATPRDSEDFSRVAVDLKRTFQQYLRDEKNEFLPAIEKALTEEEATALAEKIDADRAQTEAAERRAAEERRAEARRVREQAEAAERMQQEAEKSARRAAKAASEATLAAGEELQRRVEIGAHTAGALAERAANTANQVFSAVEQTHVSASTFLEYGSIVREAMQSSTRVWVTWAQDCAQTRTRSIADLAQCRTPLEFAELQTRVLREEMNLFFGAAARVAGATKASSEKALAL